jgi:TetR/AcrR family transcriptional repressor of nem operon
MSKQVDTRQSLVRESLKLFLLKGYNNVSLSDIAQRVGITKPAIYFHFKNKEDLADAVLNHFTHSMTEWSQKRFGSFTTTRELLRAFFLSLEDFARVERILVGPEPGETEAGSGFTDFITSAARSSPRFRVRVAEIFAASRRQLASRIREGQEEGEIRADLDPDLAALHFHALIEGLTLLGGFGSTLSQAGLMDALFTQFWKGIQA